MAQFSTIPYATTACWTIVSRRVQREHGPGGQIVLQCRCRSKDGMADEGEWASETPGARRHSHNVAVVVIAIDALSAELVA
jgi:hypothetical protein